MRYRHLWQGVFCGEASSTAVMVPSCSLRSRTLRAAFGDGLRPSLTFASRAGLLAGRSGRRDVGSRSNNGMISGCCRAEAWHERLAVAHHGEDGTEQLAQSGDEGNLWRLDAADQAI